MNYHAHVYFLPFTEAQALQIKELAPRVLRFFKHYGTKVGPHALPMLEFHFKGEDLQSVMEWLKLNRQDLSILIHADSGDDFKDHENAIWIGESLPINYEFFHQVAKNPSISVH